MKKLILIILCLFLIAAVDYGNPHITYTDCWYIVVQANNPPPLLIPPGEEYPYPAIVAVHDGDYLFEYIELPLQEYPCTECVWWKYIGDRHTPTIIEAGHIETKTGSVSFTNTPYSISCHRIFQPMVVNE